MKNRAKCKLCQSIIESFHEFDEVTCKCGEISISGGSVKFKTSAKNYDNFLRVDDEGNTITVKLQDQTEEIKKEEIPPPTKEELIEMLDTMAENIAKLPQNALSLPITHYDHYSALLLISTILKRL